MLKNREFETLKERLRKLKEIRRNEKDELKRLEIDEKIDKYQDKIDAFKKNLLKKGWVDGENGLEPFDDDSNRNIDLNRGHDFKKHDDEINKNKGNKFVNSVLFCFLLISGCVIGYYYIYLNSISNASLIFNMAVVLFPGIYGLFFFEERTNRKIYQFRIKLTKFLRPIILGTLVGVIGSFCYFFNNLFPSGLDWVPLLLILIFCIYSVALLGMSGYIDVFKFVLKELVFMLIILYYIGFLFYLIVFLIAGLENYFNKKRNGIRATEINFIDHLGTGLVPESRTNEKRVLVGFGFNGKG
jgi:hypothetical protein